MMIDRTLRFHRYHFPSKEAEGKLNSILLKFALWYTNLSLIIIPAPLCIAIAIPLLVYPLLEWSEPSRACLLYAEAGIIR